MTSTPPVTLAADAVEVAGRLRMTAFRLTRLLRQQDTEGLAPTLSAALATIVRDGPLTLGELAAREHVAPPSITKAVEKLVAAGLATRAPDETDRRVVRVTATGAGRRRVAQNRSRRTAWLAGRLTDLSPADLAKLAAATDVLERLIHQSDGDTA
jgi:DNA-binding MarR family transcriptional regulator